MFYSIALALTIFYVLNNYKNLLRSFIFLKNQKKLEDHSDTSELCEEYKIIILIPVLREQEIINTNLEIFTKLKGRYELIYISTEKENYEKPKIGKRLQELKKNILHAKNKDIFVERLVGIFPKSTAVEIYSKKNNFSDLERYWNFITETYENIPSTEVIITQYLEVNQIKNTRVLHFPYTKGKMADQLNYACDILLNEGCDPIKTFILVYNADSKIDENILDAFKEKIKTGETLMHQPSIFLSNYNSFESNYRGYILKCIALAQTRWTLIHEISRIHAQYQRKARHFYESGFLVGHGLCIRLDVLKSVDGFPQIFLNEDLALGYFLSLKGEKICLINRLENAESPTSIKSVIAQYTTWFYGAMDYFQYYSIAIKKLSINNFKAFLWATVNSFKALLWLISPWVWVYLISFPLFFGQFYLSLISMLIFLFHTIFVYRLVARFIYSNHHLFEKPLLIKIDSGVLLATPVAYLIWGFGPLLAVKNKMRSLLFGVVLNKEKTER